MSILLSQDARASNVWYVIRYFIIYISLSLISLSKISISTNLGTDRGEKSIDHSVQLQKKKSARLRNTVITI